MPPQVHILGIRHHGPGSARAVLRALTEFRPDCLLIEGPPDADALIAWAAREEMQPPVAILVYQADDPTQAVFYPLAEFSPEWCAIRWALAENVPVRFMDLPQSHRMAVDREARGAIDAKEESVPSPPQGDVEPTREDPGASLLSLDPLNALALAAGFDDGERWWEHMIENRRQQDADVFLAIREAMIALREQSDSVAHSIDRRRDDPLREAWMRRTIREAKREHTTIAVVCGAWHAAVLDDESLEQLKKTDDAKLKGLPRVKTVVTWVPWTYDHLTMASGYGAGVRSPGWYEHLWQHDSRIIEHWMTRVARLLRDQDVDCSSAHAIEATRLAGTLAALRGRPLADLSDIADASRAVFCFDSELSMQLIGRKLLVGERLGEVPSDTPMVPLQQDLQREQKRLRLKAEALEKTLDLDLRNQTDLARSHLLHRLRLLGIAWGVVEQGRGGKGTFHEIWRLSWDPAFLVRLIELGRWGNTIAAAASELVGHTATEASDLAALTRLLDDVMLADLPQAVQALMDRIVNAAAVGADVARLMDALPPLAGVLRYGNVRQIDRDMVRRAIDGIVPRIFVGLGGAVAALDDDAARAMETRLIGMHESLQLLESTEFLEEWSECLARIAAHSTVHGIVRGRATRLLYDMDRWTAADVARSLSLSLSRGTEPAQGAAWIEGFLRSSGLLLIHHQDLLDIIDEWVCAISSEVFIEQAPLLRRTFSTFAAAERRQIGERLKSGKRPAERQASTEDIVDHARAARVLPIVRLLLGSRQQEGAEP